MCSLIDIIKQKKYELLYAIENQYSNEYNFNINDLENLCPLNEHIWKTQLKINPSLCMAKKMNNTQCLKKKYDPVAYLLGGSPSGA